LILEAIKKEVGGDAADTVGIAGGACGGDILFHEVWAELGIKTQLLLALPIALFQRESVERGGEQRVGRYETLCQEKQPRILQNSLALPNWLAGRKDYSIWERNNLWMMFNALTTGATSRTLIALFNEDREPDGAGNKAPAVHRPGAWPAGGARRCEASAAIGSARAWCERSQDLPTLFDKLPGRCLWTSPDGFSNSNGAEEYPSLPDRAATNAASNRTRKKLLPSSTSQGTDVRRLLERCMPSFGHIKIGRKLRHSRRSMARTPRWGKPSTPDC
jgi:hypothetical protein